MLRHGMGRGSQRARRVAERVPRRVVPRRGRRRGARHVGLVSRRALAAVHRVGRGRTGDRLRRTEWRASTCWGTGVPHCSRSSTNRWCRDTSRCSTGWSTTCRRRPRHRRRCAWATRAPANAIVDGLTSPRWSTSRSPTSATRSATSGTASSSSARTDTPRRCPGLPTEDETWARWSAATGRELVDLDYWMAFAATVIVVTAYAGERDVGPTRLVLRGPPGAAPAVGVGRRGSAVNDRARASVRPCGVVVERVVVLLVDRPRPRSRRVLPSRTAPQPGTGAHLVVRVPRRRLVRHRGDASPLRRLRPERRYGVRPVRSALRLGPQ